MEQTLSIIKPDAVAKNVIGQIYSRFEDAGFKIVASKMIHLDEAMAGGFYAVHQERPFYKDLVSFMTSGPVMVQVLEGENAVAKHREIMGATNPKEAGRAGSRRARFVRPCPSYGRHRCRCREACPTGRQRLLPVPRPRACRWARQ